eukprot:23058_1
MMVARRQQPRMDLVYMLTKTKPTVTVSIDSSNTAKREIAGLKRSDNSTALQLPDGWDAKRNAVKAGDVVTLTISANEFIYRPTVVFKSGSQSIKDSSIEYMDPKENDTQANTNRLWTAKYTAHANDTDGNVSFSVTYKDAAGNKGIKATEVTNGTSVVTDTIKPVLQLSIASSNVAQRAIAGMGIQRPEGWNNLTNVATTGDVVTLTISANEFIYRPTASFLSNGASIGYANIDYYDTDSSSPFRANKVWACRFTVQASDMDGMVTFTVAYDDVAGNEGINVTKVTDGT